MQADAGKRQGEHADNEKELLETDSPERQAGLTQEFKNQQIENRITIGSAIVLGLTVLVSLAFCGFLASRVLSIIEMQGKGHLSPIYDFKLLRPVPAFHLSDQVLISLIAFVPASIGLLGLILKHVAKIAGRIVKKGG